MKLASLKSGGRDGTLIVVDRLLERATAVPEHAPTLQAAIESWGIVSPLLERVYRDLVEGTVTGFALDPGELAAPLPRAYQWLDGSAYLSHIERARKARGAELPPELRTDPLMYQGMSDGFLGALDPIVVPDEGWGVDFESELAVITDDVPMGTPPEACGKHVKLLMLVNDVSLRNLIPNELAKGFGFVHGKPASAFSPVSVTPDELGDAWDGARVHRPMRSSLNGELMGEPLAGDDMQFGFPELIAHAATTRSLGAGTIVGSGTVSNHDRSRGVACLIEKRVIEIVEDGAARTPFMTYGDRVRIEMTDADGASIFGAIEQEMRKPS